MAWIDTRHFVDDLGGGRFRSTLHITPAAWLKPGQGLRAIVNDWANGDVNYPHVISEAKIRVRTAPNGDRLILPVPTDDDAWFSISSPFINVAGSWVQPALGSFSRTGNLISAINPNVNTYIWHGGHYIKAGFLLKNGWQPTNGQFAFRVGLNGLSRSGKNLLYNGKPELILRAPLVYDVDNLEDARPIAFDFVNLAGSNYILFTLPSLAGMSKPLVDPTFTDGYGGDVATSKDTDIDPGFPTRNNGAANYFTRTNHKGLIEFDLSSIAADSTCNSATFYGYATAAGGAGATFVTTIYSIASGNAAWIEGTQVENTAASGEPCWNALAADGSGGVTTSWAGSAGLATSGTDYDASAIGSFTGLNNDANGTEYTASLTTSRVEGWFGAPNTNYGQLFVSDVNPTRCGSSDHTTIGYRPKLVVDYTAGGGPTGSPWYYYAQQ